MRTSINGSSPGFVADHSSVSRAGTGRQIDFSRLDDSYRQSRTVVKANGVAARGATSVTVDALGEDLPVGTQLDFGDVANVTVTTSGVAAAAATSIAVNALSGPIPSGTLLDFTGAGEIALTTADVAAGATSIPVEALDAQIESGDTATYQGGSRLAVLTAPAAKGATSITVDELPFAVPDNAEATATGGNGPKVVKAGTIVAELASGKVIPRKSVTGAETALGFLVSDAAEGDRSAARTGYGVIVGCVAYEELLPDNAEAGFDTWIGEIRDNGGWVRLETYADSSAA